jgi:SAM-dependent methyltransferase
MNHTIEELKEILYNKELDKKLLYQPLEHPEFTSWEAQQPCVERWEMISKELDIETPGTVLDLGCYTGWFCRQFSRHGWQALGIDKGELEIEIASEHMQQFAGEPKPSYILGDFRDFKLIQSDVVLCLSVIMYLFEEYGWRTVDRISKLAPKMFLDVGGMYSDRLPFSSENAGREIVRHTTYTSWRLLGHTNLESRPLFLLER